MDFKLLLKVIKKEELSQVEQERFTTWYKQSEEHRKFYNNLKREALEDITSDDLDRAWVELKKNMGAKPKKNLRKYYYIAAASIFLFLVFNFFLHYQKEITVSDFAPVVIEVGTNKATLQLSNGSLIDLEKDVSFDNESVTTTGEELIYTQGSPPAEEEMKYNELTVPKGGQYKVTLSDGTRVWLNSDTRLKYPISFKENAAREVELVYGEAYFEVTSSTANHGNNFWVLSSEQRIEVLGTSFNVSDYKEDEGIRTTLVEGKVSLSLKNKKDRISLEPGFQSHYTEDFDNWKIEKVNTDFVVAWKEGYFKFRDMSLGDIMKTIARWYDVEVQFRDETLKTTRFNGVFRKDQEMEDILDIMKENTAINYRLKGRELAIFQGKSSVEED